ncbi:hypothetical protein PTW37_14895 [Arthrobacter agilis]|uniref:hypothetical protein n=1 Tax=Arthrobacter agilis TaxID=37921 RepID=UPI00236724C8|nr:hypothetical protein [Arthrobacter agilis]WDF33118.1 hypothetical protein PTW37_14895 [Arthrobacter agilis]
MPRSTPFTGLALATLLVLTGCSSAEPGEESTPAAVEPTAAASASTGAEPDETGSYSSDELATIVGGITEADGSPLQLIPTEQIRQSMDQARQFLDAVTVSPAECSVFVSNSLDAPEGAGIATGVSSSDGDAIQTIVSAASSPDIGSSSDGGSASAEALGACSSFTVEAQGVAIEQTVEPLEAATGADTTVGTTTVQTSADGGRQQTMTIVGTRGDLAVTAVRTAKDALADDTQDELEDLIDAALDAARRD